MTQQPEYFETASTDQIAAMSAPLLEGVYFDCVHGTHNEARVIDLARDYGCEAADIDEAERFLQDLVPSDCYFGTNDCGDWGVFPLDDGDRCDCDGGY